MIRLILLALTGACLAGPAFAQPDLFSPSTIGGVVNGRAVSGDAEKSWTDGGFGKSRFGDRSDGLIDGVVQWRPRLGWSLSGVVDVVGQPDLIKKLDVNEAYLLFKPLGSGGTRWQARLGLLYPPVSLEHDGRAWTTTRTITPSAINSWIGEEVYGAGLEVAVRRTFGEQELGLTVGVFDKNDTAGTLLTFRGWSLNDARATLKGKYELPPLSAFPASLQDEDTYPAWELDDRFGYYVRADWKPPQAFSVNAIYYDNLGDKTSVDPELQWSWYTRFTNVGITWQPAENTEVLAQAMKGVTAMGYTSPFGRWFDTRFEAAYVLATQTFGANAVSGRLDYFRNSDRANGFYGDTSEHGWAGTLDYVRTFSPQAKLYLEALRIDSERPSRVLAGDAPRQHETVLQAMTRFSF
ncbi:MAG TPA: hypothetical protein VFN88_02875 [Caulobacteraceae bacterium]|nr:hypothetical protein [Caulobacteraceae bacterium]